MTAVDMGMGRDQQIRLKPAQQTDHIETTSKQGAGLGDILKLNDTPIDLMHPGTMALDPVVKSDSCAGEDARVLEHMLNQNLPIWIPAFQPGLDRISRCIMSSTTAGGEDLNPHQL